MQRNIVIIGAGVVGLSLAKTLASEGLAVTVYDSKRRVSDNAFRASGILSASGLERIKIPYKNAVVNRLRGAVLHVGNETLRVKAEETKALVVDRARLAEACLKEAEKAGAEVMLGTRADRDAVKEIARDKSRILVGADGAVSTVASAFSFPPIEEYALTYKADYEDARVEDDGIVNMFFSGLAPRFFAWTAPHSKKAVEGGIGVSSFARRDSASAFKSFEKTNGMLRSARFVRGSASIIPLGTRSVTVKGNVALVGDAAGQVKATTGGGIIFGVSCANILADTIKGCVNRGMPLSHYEREWRKKYGRDLKLHRLFHNRYPGKDTMSLKIIFKLARIMGAESFLSTYGDMDRPSATIKRFFLRDMTS
jgi:flavin-dependent dehydrogenase